MEGAAYYYYGIPKNPVNDWLVAEHEKRFHAPPDFFTAGGFAAAMAVVAAVEKAKSTDAEKLIPAMEGMAFDTPKGKMIFRKEDHQALQSMYAFKIKVDPNVAWGDPGAHPGARRSRIWTSRSATSDDAVARDARSHHPLRRTCRGRSRLVRVPARRAHRHRRAERRGQDDLFQPDVGAIARVRRRRPDRRTGSDPPQRAATHAARARARVSAHQSLSAPQRRRKRAARRSGPCRRPLRHAPAVAHEHGPRAARRRGARIRSGSAASATRWRRRCRTATSASSRSR